MEGTRTSHTHAMKKPKSAKNHPKPSVSSRPADEPTNEEVAALAYSIWEQEGRPEGRDLEHWRAAEAQLRQAHAPGGSPGA
jgi:hypothetical protein